MLLSDSIMVQFRLGAGLPTRAQKVMKRALVLVRTPSRILNAALLITTADERLQRLPG
jgi:hypothetical protein